MSKKSTDLLPLLDYLRIHRVIRSVLDSANVDTAHACWYFSLAGAAILRIHYKKEAHALAGAMCLMSDMRDSSVMCFAKIENNEVHSSVDAFHAMVACDGYLIDFMTPIFPETAASSNHAFLPPAKSFQRKIETMKPSPADLVRDGDFFFDPNMELTDSLLRKVVENQFLTDVVQGCSDWYRKPPKTIPSVLTIRNEKGQVSHVRLKDASVIGAW